MNDNIKALIEQAISNAPFECASYTKRQWLETFADLVAQDYQTRLNKAELECERLTKMVKDIESKLDRLIDNGE